LFFIHHQFKKIKMTRLFYRLSFIATIVCISCNLKPTEMAATTGVTKKDWGEADGQQVYLYTLTNKEGDVVTISSYGGTVTSWIMPDKNGNKSSIVMGFDSITQYLEHPPYFGALVGRYGNRIAKAQFKLGDSVYHLAANNGPNSLHGGLKGFDKVVWDVSVPDSTTPSITLKYISKDGEEGYPGNLSVTVVYTLSDDDGLKIDYTATTDKPTPLNLTNHSYFNLTGSPKNSILDHTLMVNADKYTPVDSTLIPTGELKAVKGTPFDFTTAKKIGQDIASVPGGYDHNFVLNKKDTSLQKAATLSDSISGRQLDVYTTQPGLQFYTGNFLDGKFINRDSSPLNVHTALCMETQHFPDSPNQPSFPSTILKPGEVYHNITEYKLSLMK
jgi:aldose 1-epimerase